MSYSSFESALITGVIGIGLGTIIADVNQMSPTEAEKFHTSFDLATKIKKDTDIVLVCKAPNSQELMWNRRSNEIYLHYKLKVIGFKELQSQAELLDKQTKTVQNSKDVSITLQQIKDTIVGCKE